MGFITYDRQKTEYTMLCVGTTTRRNFSGWSSMWDITVGGALSGEDSRTASERELFEELRLLTSFETLRPALTIHFDDVYLIE